MQMVSIANRLPQCMVACNVYVSAACSDSAPTLIRLAQRAQDICLRNSDTTTSSSTTDCTNIAGLVHAYADVSYDRSSFHFAGSSVAVANAVSVFARDAIGELSTVWNSKHSSSTDHPTVGLVDHISVMPLHHHTIPSSAQKKIIFSEDDIVGTGISLAKSTPNNPTNAAGWTARAIGGVMEEAGASVFYYGNAHPQQESLARVRREKTDFFKNLPCNDNGGIGQATIGAPSSFVENYNVRLHKCSKLQARTLTMALREIDGGLPGVEALTLPYICDRWEVACNLLCPEESSAERVQEVVDRWQLEQGNEGLVDVAYRVGTTSDQCNQMLDAISRGELAGHNDCVLDRFKADLR